MTRGSTAAGENKACWPACKGEGADTRATFAASIASKSYAGAVAVAAIGYVSGEMREGVARILLPQRRQR
jgi:hypothetical protein